MTYDAFAEEERIQDAVNTERTRIAGMIVGMWEHRDDDKSVRCYEINALLHKLGSKSKLEEP